MKLQFMVYMKLLNLIMLYNRPVNLGRYICNEEGAWSTASQ